MKSRLKKSLMRATIKGVNRNLANPEPWSDEQDEFYMPYVHEAALLGINLESWGYPEVRSSEKTYPMSASFVYSYITRGGRVKNDIGFIDISDYADASQVSIYSSNDINIFFRRSRIYGKVKSYSSCFSILCDSNVGVFNRMMPIISDYLSEFHQSEILFSGSFSSDRNESIENSLISKQILKSFWDYAVNGCRHLYRLNSDGGFDEINIDEDQLIMFKEDYDALSKRIECSCGTKSFKIMLDSYGVAT